MQETKDITNIGAGPTGLFAAFYAGMRGASHCLIDNLDQVGGQLTALYPEKYIFDVAGFPKILAKDLVKGMAEQGLQWKGSVHLAQKVTGLKRTEENGKLLFTIVTDKDEYPGRSVLIAGGIGAFTPRKLPLKDVDQWNDKGLHDRVLNPREFAGKRVLIVGGGDSAFDWAVDIEKGDIQVAQTMETNIPGIYAAGDITTYPGKLKLIATGVAEACIAVNHAVHFLNPTAKFMPGHSSNMAIFGQKDD